MTNQQHYSQMAVQLGTILDKAREHFSDSLAEVLEKKGIELQLAEKMEIEKLFSDAFHAYICSELTAFIGYIIFNEYKNEEILNRILPDFLDTYEKIIGNIPEPMKQKTKGLSEIANKMLESDRKLPAVVKKLLSDIDNISDTNRFRASFNAVLLSMMGE